MFLQHSFNSRWKKFLIIFARYLRIKILFLFLIRAYQRVVSPFFRPACRFYPTCSEYAYQSIGRYGVMKGGFLSVKRLLRCHPFHPGGYDPVP